ncbi:MAG: acyl-CoA dehydrogenase C-terminal domain-containing protein [Candidatus Thiodiazotropha sp.]
MPIYTPPVRDMLFAYFELNGGEAIRQMPGYEQLDRETLTSILEEAGRFVSERLLPLNRSGDEAGCNWNEGRVTTPEGFKAAYDEFIQAGWNSIAFDTDYGGQGLPKSLHMLVDEMICACNLSFSLYPGLTNGAWTALEDYADTELKALYFPKMAEGVWSGTMCLTEPHSGSDLGLMRTRAEHQEDGSYRISGTKIFITAGEHDLTENIIHLVLARTTDAPAGIKGISLFLVPKILPDAQGGLGEINSLSCGAIEHKMGIKASATCVLNFDGAKGWLVGEVNKGMRAMFKMMNTERLATGIQGLGIAEAAYQNAVAYAQERLQGRSPKGAQQPDTPADPLIVHPDIRRMLLTMRALTEGCRALSVWVAQQIDIAARSPDVVERREAEGLVALLTPVVKAFFTDCGFEVANLGMQVFGGHGYIREQGMEQLVRDARIGQIYEGANGVQAMDLVGRKLPLADGTLIERFLLPLKEFLQLTEGDASIAEFTTPLAAAGERLESAAKTLLQRAGDDPLESGAGAADFLQLFGLTALALMWARMALIGLRKCDEEEPLFYEAKVRTARFFMLRILPRSEAHYRAIMAGGDCMIDFDDRAW